MAVKEEKDYLELMNSEGTKPSGAQAEAAALSEAENRAKSIDYSTTADGKLDAAIDSYLSGRGFKYSTAKDPEYRAYLQRYRSDSDRGRELSENTARALSGGYKNSYAGYIGSEVYNDRMNDISDAAPSYESMAQTEAAMRKAQEAQGVQIMSDQASDEYNRSRDYRSDLKNYMNYLATEYQNERQNELDRQSAENQVYSSKLSQAESQMEAARSYENQKYQYDTQSASNRATNEENEYENDLKIAYKKAEDEYNDKVSAAKAETSAQKTAATNAEKYQKKLDSANKDVYKIGQYIAGKRKLSGDDGYNLDYNGDGTVDTRDLTLAKQQAGAYEAAVNQYAAAAGSYYTENNIGTGTGSSDKSYSLDASDKATALIKEIDNSRYLELRGARDSNKFARHVENLINKRGLSDDEAAYIAAYYGL